MMEITSSSSSSFKVEKDKEKEKNSSPFTSLKNNFKREKDEDKEKNKDKQEKEKEKEVEANKESDKVNRLLEKLKKQIEKDVQQKYASDLKELEKLRLQVGKSSSSSSSSSSSGSSSSKIQKSPSIDFSLGGTLTTTNNGQQQTQHHHHSRNTSSSTSNNNNNINNNNQPVILNVGGQIHQTMKSTLVNNSGYFEIYFGDYNTQPNPITGQYFIDKRCHYFHLILDHLRGEDIHYELKDGKVNIEVLKHEFNYFEIDYTNVFPKHKFDRFTRHNSMEVVPGNYTIIHRGEKMEHMGITTIKGYTNGVHKCRFRIDKINDESSWMCFGTAYSSSSSASPYVSSYSLSSMGQKYPEGSEGPSRASDWITSDVIRVELDCDNRSQRVINERTNKTETFDDLPSNLTLYFYVNILHPGNQVTIICDDHEDIRH